MDSNQVELNNRTTKTSKTAKNLNFLFLAVFAVFVVFLFTEAGPVWQCNAVGNADGTPMNSIIIQIAIIGITGISPGG